VSADDQSAVATVLSIVMVLEREPTTPRSDNEDRPRAAAHHRMGFMENDGPGGICRRRFAATSFNRFPMELTRTGPEQCPLTHDRKKFLRLSRPPISPTLGFYDGIRADRGPYGSTNSLLCRGWS
jgi:hypothetical protein